MNTDFLKKSDTIYIITQKEAITFLEKKENSIYFSSLSPISEEGLFKSLVACCEKNNLGFDITTDSEIDEDQFLDGKTKYIAIISVNSDQEDDFVELMYDNKYSLTLLGHVTKGELRIDDISEGYIQDYLK
ncbi:MAG: hypothetical protein WCS34_01290 [Bacteroidales bacterium]